MTWEIMLFSEKNFKVDLCLKEEKYLTIRTINFIQRENEIICYPICTFFF